MERFTTADGRALAYRRIGAGRELVCHPGGPGFSARYFGDLAGLGRDRTLVLLDPRGTGRSDPPADSRAYENADYVSDVEELRAHLGLERIDLLGHSHGGIVAQAYAAAYPDRVGALVLADTAARFGPEQLAAMEEGMAAKADEPWYEDARAALEARAGRFVHDAGRADRARPAGVPVLLRPLRRAGARMGRAAARRGDRRRRAQALQRGDLHELRPPPGARPDPARERS